MFETLKGRIPKSIDEDEYRKFAVMVALLKQEDGLHVVFEKRAGGLKRQPGEICLPGGARDGNESSEDNAIRETMEELEISREQIHMITQMDTLYTAYDNKVSVYLCELRDYDMTYNADEVFVTYYVGLQSSLGKAFVASLGEPEADEENTVLVGLKKSAEVLKGIIKENV